MAAHETNYSARITSQPVTGSEMASHRQYLAAVKPLTRGLEQVRDDHADKFTAAELEILAAARRLLEINAVPRALIEVEEDPAPLFL